MIEWGEGNVITMYLAITHHIEGLPTHTYQMALTEKEAHNFIADPTMTTEHRALTYALYCIKKARGEGFEDEGYQGRYTYTICIYFSDGVDTEREFEAAGMFTIDGYDARNLEDKINELQFSDMKNITMGDIK